MFRGLAWDFTEIATYYQLKSEAHQCDPSSAGYDDFKGCQSLPTYLAESQLGSPNVFQSQQPLLSPLCHIIPSSHQFFAINAWYLAAACGSGFQVHETGGDKKGTWQTKETTISWGYVLGNRFGYHLSC